ncbi:hypothetical protein HED60_01310 [Planctomycetales bacterium ZRK34]|nr:hypothetical protein HED60_01310 [Planctomycetales bacterium ZRK34]
MKIQERMASDEVLYNRMRWFIGLRWLAGAAVMTLSLIDAMWWHWHVHAMAMVGVGASILVYNHVLWWLLMVARNRRGLLIWLAPAQILLDMFCLTLLTLWTGDAHSPLIGFYVFHMIFASLMLPRWMAYATAGVALIMLSGGLAIAGHWPRDLDGQVDLLAWAIVQVATVYLVSGMARRLRRHRYHLMLQNQRISEMANQLRDQQQAMVQHEKLAAMGQMAAGIAHEIANPLASIDSLLQLMKRNTKRLTEANLEKLSAQSERIRRTIQQMTEFAHPSPVQWRAMALNDLAAMGLEMIRFDHRHRRIDIQRDFRADGCVVNIQPQAIQQVLINLLINAMDALADIEKPCIIVRTTFHDDYGRIEIIDNGPGISADKLEHVFEPFYTTKPVGKGTGLGLAISYNLIRGLGGRIRILSHSEGPDRGATVQVDLPLYDDEATQIVTP